MTVSWIMRNWFLIGLGAVVLLAWQFPDPGVGDGFLHSRVTGRLGVVVIFFLQGLSLSLGTLRSGILQWKLHLFVETTVFVIIPLMGLTMITAGAPWLSEDLQIGVLFLAALPSTIATSVAYTAMTAGNVAAAVFNSTFSNIAGIFITPLWIGMWLKAGNETLPYAKVFLDISMMLLLPLLLGQVIRPLLRPFIDRHQKKISLAISLIILFIIYTVFCNSWKQSIWTQQGTEAALMAAGIAILLFLAATGISAAGIRIFHFQRENAMAVLFCAPQKTLAAGVSFANLMFAGHPGLGLILLPILFYHPLQLLAGGLLINWINQQRRLLGPVTK